MFAFSTFSSCINATNYGFHLSLFGKQNILYKKKLLNKKSSQFFHFLNFFWILTKVS